MKSSKVRKRIWVFFGCNEINLPQLQPGSSIMPGKMNPVIPEVVNEVSFHATCQSMQKFGR